MSILTENAFESALVQSLIESGKYELGDSSSYSKDLGFFREEIIYFIKRTQPSRWTKIEAVHGADVENRVLQRLYKEMDLRGSLDVLRNGFTDFGIRFQMAYFQPVSNLNTDAITLYDSNSLKVYRQIYYSKENKNSVDVLLSLNGIPVATMELKNQFTGQNINDALKQYSTTRDNRDILFAFKKRALVHFAVDQDEVFMTTRLDGNKTYWLPFNQGYKSGKGNPPNSGGYRTAYLWESILAKDSWMEIIQQFIHLQTEEIEAEGRLFRKERLIFPRYHQLDAVRQVSTNVIKTGVGQNYLIQHSAGSGKSNSIAWLAYRLSSLHNNSDERIFDSVIVVTDRQVLDSQLQNTIYQIEHKTGVVQKIDKDSNQLASALTFGTNIIITTLQKFPYVVDKVGSLPDRKYAVIIDEAHSSQGGEASKKLKEVLALKSFEDDAEDEIEDNYSNDDFIREQIELSANSRGQQRNISFFAFTATPKYKTLQVFGYKDEEGKPKSFHLYSMRQAIEEGFILDVLQNYITYELYFRLTKAIEDDPHFNKNKAAKAIGKYVSLHPYNLAQKTEVIIEHFREVVSKKIGGKAKAMLVCGSRLHAKRYYEEFERYIEEKGYASEIKVLVAFSGKVKDDNYPNGVLESELTGYGERELPEVFEKDEYKILIVADKYQTGFDQPLLHTMYVDKKLSGVKAVQTLSRLNRIFPGKEDTFILDFANERETILESFQPYYEATTVSGDPDINHLFDLKQRLDQTQVYWESEINSFAEVYFDPIKSINNIKDQKYLYAFTDNAVDRYRGLHGERQEEFKKGLRTWTNLYAFLSQIMPFVDVHSEKFYAFAKLLQTRLPKKDLSEVIHLDDEIALEYYRLQKIKEGAIELRKDNENGLSGVTEAGLKKVKEEVALLSEIIHLLNDRFGTTFEDADKLFFDQIEAELLTDDTLKLQAQVNKLDTFKYAFDDKFIEKLIGRMDQNHEIFEKILENNDFGSVVKEFIMRRVYREFNK